MPRSRSLWPCTCGCGGLTGGQFVPGHDARLRGWLLQIWRTGGAPYEANVPWNGYTRDDAQRELDRRGWLPSQHGSRQRAQREYRPVTRTPVMATATATYTAPPAPAPLPVIDSDDRRFGIEIECLAPHGMTPDEVRFAPPEEREQRAGRAVRHALEAVGIACEPIAGYGSGVHRTRPHWKVVHDGSVHATGIHNTHAGVEVVSPPLKGRDGERELEKVMGILAGMGAKVNQTCGMHVHQDAADITGPMALALIQGYAANQEMIDYLVAPSRRDRMGTNAQTYCRAFTQRELGFVSTRSPADVGELAARLASRYRVVNLQAFGRHGTIEFRQHQGSVEYSKAIGWIRFTRALMAHATAAVPLVGYGYGEESLRMLLTDLSYACPSLRDWNREYLVRRYRRFLNITPATAAV